MTSKDIAHLRLINQSIAAPRFDTAEEVVNAFVAMQAQDYGQALWAIGLRTKALTKTHVEQAVAEGKILRTWPMRGTIHFMTPRDAKWMLKLLTPRIISGSRSRRVNLDITDAVLAKAADIIGQALEGGRRLRRSAVLELLENAGISTREQRGYHILWYLAHTGLVCIGPMDGKQPTFVLLDEWAPQAIILGREESLRELTKRYFVTHGPATLADMVWWSGMTMSNARIGLELAKSDLTAVTVNGAEYWLGRDAHDAADTSGAHLLAGFDEYLLGYRDRNAAVLPGTAPASVNGIFFPIIVVDGQVVGLWKRVAGSKQVVITFAPFQPLDSKIMTAMRYATKRYGAFIELPLAFPAK